MSASRYPFGREGGFSKHLSSTLLTPSAAQVTVKDAIGNLPPLRSSISREEDTIERWKEIRNNAPTLLTSRRRQLTEPLQHFLTSLGEPAEYTSVGSEFSEWLAPRVHGPMGTWYADPRLGGHITNHATRGHIRGDLERYWFVAAFREAMGYSPKSIISLALLKSRQLHQRKIRR